METNPTQIIIGIDPGTTGAISTFEIVNRSITSIRIIDYASPEAIPFLRAIVGRMLFENVKTNATIEELGFRPGQDIVRSGRYAITHGIVQGWLQALSIPYSIVNPRTWQAKIYKSLGSSFNALDYPDVKPRHLAIARMLFDGCPDVIRDIRRAKDHNRADSLLIAWYAWLVHQQGAA